MQEQTRTKLLAGLLLGTVGYYVAEPHTMITKPLAERRNDLDRALSAKETAERAEMELLDAQFNLSTWRGQSLPPDGQTAQNKYRDWVTVLAEECGFGGPKFSVDARGRTKATARKGKGVVYEAVAVKVTAEATLSQLTQFLYRFKKTGLIHRVRDLNVSSPDTEGDPYLEVVLVAEGLSLQSAEPRLDLFPRTSVEAEIDEEAEEIPVEALDQFPTQPGFIVKSGREYMEVTAIDAEKSTLTVKRGVQDSEPELHESGARLEHIPIAKAMADTSFADYEKFLAGSPFIKPVLPRTYEPAIDTILKKDVVRGQELKFTVTTSDMDAAKGDAVFALKEDHPEGMGIDPKSGELTWKTETETELKEYMATVLVTQAENPELKLEREFTVALVDRNNEPKLTVPRQPTVAWLGRTATVPLTVEDETSADKLAFAVEGVEGAYVDSKTNALNWPPAEDLEPGEYTAKVKVTDEGGKTAEAEVRFIARDDAARYTKFTAAVGRNDRMEAMLYDQINNKQTSLEVGSKLSVADITGTVKEIDTKSFVLSVEEGDMLVRLGKDLRTTHDAFAKQQASKPVSKDAE